MIDCLPILIQFPILFYPSNDGIERFPYFLWFDLTKPNLWISFIAAFIYFVQPLVNTMHYLKNQKNLLYINDAPPIFITYILLHSVASLGLYWSFSRLFLILQMHFTHTYYSRLAKKEATQLQQSIHKTRLKIT